MSMTESAPVNIAGVASATEERLKEPATREALFSVDGLRVTYAGVPALDGVSLEIYRNQITAFIGPSGCGKSTFIRCFNRMNDLIPSAKVEGSVLYHGLDLYGRDVDPVEVRKRIGMVFQKPNPFPKSIYDNVAFGPRILGWKDSLDDRVRLALEQAARVSDRTAFFTVDPEDRVGRLVEYDETPTIFTKPADKRTEDYVTGRFG